mmetsp:Transcript_70691/g.166679  ORF Transcript_70691/g.166679 Transcript_70691/m.166679 type:complete len:642 (+) Transcript_70691:22-1947(+)
MQWEALCQFPHLDAARKFEELIHRDPNAIEKRDYHENSPLHLCALNNNHDVLKVLISNRADVNVKERNQWTPLHIAVRRQHTDCVRALLDSNADITLRCVCTKTGRRLSVFDINSEARPGPKQTTVDIHNLLVAAEHFRLREQIQTLEKELRERIEAEARAAYEAKTKIEALERLEQQAAARLEEQTTVNQYTVEQLGRPLRLIGSGGYGSVHLHQLRNEDGGVLVAVKTRHSDGGQRLEKSAKRELESLRLLRHPDIVSLYGIGPNGQLVMEYVDGIPLSRLIEQYKDRLLPLMIRLDAAMHVASAMAYLHGRGVVHRDLKPANVVVSQDRKRYKVCDFGLARDLGGEPQTQFLQTTIRYASPSLLLGNGFEQADDLWAFAGLLLEMAVGHPPHHDLDRAQLQHELLRGTLGTLGEKMVPQVDHRTPPAIRDLAERCCHPEPALRGDFASAWEVCVRTRRECFGFLNDPREQWIILPGCSVHSQTLDPHSTSGVNVMQKLMATGSHTILRNGVSQLRLVRNDALLEAFLFAQTVLRDRCLVPAVFGPKWRDTLGNDGGKREQRRPGREETMRWLHELSARASPIHNAAEPHMLLLVFHCTTRSKAAKICETGFAALATEDPGFYGQGMYFTPDADYAWRV